MHFVRIFVACALVVLLVGCSASGTSGNQLLQPENVSKIQKGVTTRQEVETMFGPPHHVSMWPDGRRIMIYEGMQHNNDMSGTVVKSVIPFAALVPSSDTSTIHRQMLQIYLNTDNIVQDYEFSDTTSGTKTTSSVFGAWTEQVATPNPSPDPSGK